MFTGARRARAWLAVSILALVLILVARSTPRLVGDAGEYIAMSLNLARLHPPSLTPTELHEASLLFPGEAGIRITQPMFLAADGRQDLVHFWFYSLLAAPFVRVATALGADPITGFTALNIVLLIGLTVLLSSRISSAAVVLVVVSPVLWWVDKAHTEVFTFSLVAAALLLMRSAPWWSIAAFGAAATQNPPMAVAMVITAAFALYQQGWRDRRVWIAAAAGALLAGLHPAYYYSRFGVWSGLANAVDRHWPSLREFVAVAFDPSLGVFMYAPVLAVAIGIAVVEALGSPERRRLDLAGGVMVLIAALFLFSFTQTANVNSGGTPGPSRYGLWLIPFAVPILASVRPSAMWLRWFAGASAVWCVWVFAPNVPERYLEPSTLASAVWARWPGADNPLAEVFAERVAGQEGAKLPVATPGCEKLLLVGDGNSAAWPARCTSVALPDFCRSNGALCYANEARGTYRFVKAPATPGWRRALARMGFNRLPSADRMLAVTQESTQTANVAVWHDQGWSYLEQLTTPMPDDVFLEWRWIDQRALVGVNSGSPVQARLEFVARAFKQPRRLRISIDGRDVVTQLVTTSIGAFRTAEFSVPAGRSMVTFESLDGADQPGTDDPRRLSVQVYRIELVVVR